MKLRVLLGFALLAGVAGAAPGALEIEKAALRSAQALDGVLRNCPASFSKIGTDAKKCVGVGGTVEQVRVKLGAALGADLYGVWRSRDEQRTVFNWVKVGGGYVYVRLQPDPDGRAQTLVYLDAPPEGSSGASVGAGAPSAPSTQIGNVTLSPAPAQPGVGSSSGGTAGSGSSGTAASGTAPASPAPTSVGPVAVGPASSPAGNAPTPGSAPVGNTVTQKPPAPVTPTIAATPALVTPPAVPAASKGSSLAPMPFGRVLQLQTPRMNGADVRAVQNRLIALMRPVRAGSGDGWYGPVTTSAVKAFQAANGLSVTGRVDQATWDILFSAGARVFKSP